MLMQEQVAPHCDAQPQPLPPPNDASAQQPGQKKRGRKFGSLNKSTIERQEEIQRLLAAGRSADHLMRRRGSGKRNRRTVDDHRDGGVVKPVTSFFMEGASIDAVQGGGEAGGAASSEADGVSQFCCHLNLPPDMEAHLFMETDTPRNHLVRQYQTMYVDLSNGAPPRLSCNTMYQDWERANVVDNQMRNAPWGIGDPEYNIPDFSTIVTETEILELLHPAPSATVTRTAAV